MDDAVAIAVKSATERARQTVLTQDTGSDAPELSGANFPGGRTEDIATGAKHLVGTRSLEELQGKAVEVAQVSNAARALLFEDLDTLRAERGAIIERLQAVLDAWKVGSSAEFVGDLRFG